MTDDLPTVVSTGEWVVGPLTLRVHVLSNGQRVIDADDARKFFDFLDAVEEVEVMDAVMKDARGAGL